MGAVSETYQTDILIVGGGGAAAMAALEASRLGITPLMVCKDTFLGGATVQASGGTSVPFLPEDSPATFFDDTMKSGAFINNRELVETLSKEARQVFYGLESWGCCLDRLPSSVDMRSIKRSEGHSVMRSYADRRQFHGIVGGLKRRFMQEGIGLLEERMLLKLLVEEGRVKGGLFFRLEDGGLEVIEAKAVILVTGGCGQLYPLTTNAQCLSGDGYALAYEAGAELVDMEMVQFLPLAFPFPATFRGAIIGMCSLFGPKVRLYNGLGERYMERYDPERLEFATRDKVARANYMEIQAGRGTRHKAIVVDPTPNDRSLLPKYRSSMAVAYGMIEETFGPKAANWEGTFEAIPSQHFMMGGVRIDAHCRTAVEGLLCCGEVSGGLHGANRLAGNALTEIFVFGTRAGRQAVEFAGGFTAGPLHSHTVNAAVRETKDYLGNSEGIPPIRLRKRLQKLMWDQVGIVRNGEDLAKAVKGIRRLERDLAKVRATCRSRRWNRELMETLELRLMVRTGQMIATSALRRTESRGSHYRTDYPQLDDKWRKNVVLRKVADDVMEVSVRNPTGSAK